LSKDEDKWKRKRKQKCTIVLVHRP
jgi:hypothetical protein